MGCCLNLLLGLVKTVVTVLILINIRSFPLVWHVRILVNELVLERLRALRITSVWLPLWKTKSDARLTQKDVVPQLEASRVFAGQSIFEVQSVRKGRVWPDVVDYNLHLSNSCYASIVDLSRMRFWVRFFVRMGSDGGTAALGGADYTYHAEIPFMAPFQVETFVQAWDEKWLCTCLLPYEASKYDGGEHARTDYIRGACMCCMLFRPCGSICRSTQSW